MKRLLIIDGNAIVHRAFHAFPALTRSDGQLVNAVYGFFSILIKALDEVKPEYLAICFDRPAPTFRKQLYVGYQAHRPKMADGLSDQMKLLHEALDAIGIPLFEIDGYEADDLIGTLATQATQNQESRIKNQEKKQKSHVIASQSADWRGNPNENTEDNGIASSFDTLRVRNDVMDSIETIILSADRDLLQLVNSQVKMLAPVTGITKFILFDETTVLEKYGVKPSQVTDYKALAGDASDGYPGVNGIGPKTAIGLIKTYESFENLYHHLHDLPEKIALKLATDAEQAALAKKLATITLDAPVNLDLSVCSINLFTREKVEAMCDAFGFNSLKKRLDVFGNIKEKKVHIPKKIGKKNEGQLELI